MVHSSQGACKFGVIDKEIPKITGFTKFGFIIGYVWILSKVSYSLAKLGYMFGTVKNSLFLRAS